MNKGRVEQQGAPDEVYDRPATPFVFDFLGNVNLFHGRVHEGQAHLGGIELSSPEHAKASNAAAVGYVRSHDIELERIPSDDSAFEATVLSIHPVGPVVRVVLLSCAEGTVLEADISRDAAEKLQLKKDECLFARPRKVHLFVDDYQI
jgi:sulfate transport system ATP-binding protein